MRRVSAHLTLTPRGLEPGVVVTVSDGGVITDVSRVERLDGEAGVEFFEGVLIPGFVNAHCHLELSHLRGAIASGGGFTEFAKGMRSVRGRFSDEQRRQAAEFWDAKMWAEGVSAVGDVSNGSGTFELKRRSHINYHTFCEIFGLGADPGKVFAPADEARAAGLSVSVTPHSTYSLSKSGFAAAVRGGEADGKTTGGGKVAGGEKPLSIHFMESAAEVELFRRRGPMWDWYAGQGLTPHATPGLDTIRTLDATFKSPLDFLEFGGPAERLVAQVPKERPVMLIHNCRVTQRDIDIVMGHFTAPVTWVVCPRSNRYISGERPPLELLRTNGLDIAVGTDSLASNEGLSMVAELVLLGEVSRADTTLEEMLRRATVNGALALGMDDTLGSIEVGKTPGLAVISGIDLGQRALTANAKATRII